MPSDRPARSLGSQTELYRYAGVGMHFAATLGLFGLIGFWLDGKWGTGPWLLIVGVFVGFGLGLFSLVSKLSPAPQDTSQGPEEPLDR